MNEIIVATKNKGKAKEFKYFFNLFNIRAYSLLDLTTDIPDVEETGNTFQENAQLKAEQICTFLDTPVIADDSGLAIDALNGRPGIYSARYAGENKSDQDNIEKVLEELKGIPEDKRTARFVCVLALARPNDQTIYRTGTCEGTIAYTTIGTNGFGYDPIFIPEGYTKTMAQLTAQEKNTISHRSHAIKQLKLWLEEYSG